MLNKFYSPDDDAGNFGAARGSDYFPSHENKDDLEFSQPKYLPPPKYTRFDIPPANVDSDSDNENHGVSRVIKKPHQHPLTDVDSQSFSRHDDAIAIPDTFQPSIDDNITNDDDEESNTPYHTLHPLSSIKTQSIQPSDRLDEFMGSVFDSPQEKRKRENAWKDRKGIEEK